MDVLKKVVFAAALVAFLIALLTAGSMVSQIFWQAGMAIIAIDIAIILLWPERPDWTKPGHCVHCGYDITGDTAGRCPECGKEIVWRREFSSLTRSTSEDKR